MKSKVTAGFIGFFTGILAVANAELAPLANVPETWTAGPSGWVTAGDMTASVNQGFTLQYPAQTFDPNSMPSIVPCGKVAADAVASGGRFVGNYSNAAIDRVAFDLVHRGIQTAVLQLKCASLRVWQREFAIPSTPEQIAHIELPLVFSSETWGKAPRKDGAGEAEFARDMSSITRIAVWTIGGTEGAGYLTVKNFKLVGPWEKGAMTADGIALAWLELHKLTVGEGQADLDKDDDGFSNRAEFLAGTDPNDDTSKLIVKVDTAANGNPTLRWKREDYRSYSVLTASSLTAVDTFTELANAVVKNAGSENECTVEEPAASTRFYKVQIK